MSPVTLRELFIEFKKRGISKGEVAKTIGITDTYLSKVISGEKPITDSFKGGLSKYYGKTLKEIGIDISTIKTEPGYKTTEGQKEQLVMEAPAIEYNQPIIQVVLNLSYTGKKNAESIDKMADSNLLNAKSIATLVNMLASNSDLSALLDPSQISQDMPDDLPAEAFLGKGGSDFLSKQKQAGRKKVGHK
jgi:transcriptional regulator with XRE-family HTH domain